VDVSPVAVEGSPVAVDHRTDRVEGSPVADRSPVPLPTEELTSVPSQSVHEPRH